MKGTMLLKTQLQSTNNDIKTPRAVYIFRRPCIQTFQRLIIRYFNFCLRPVEDIFAFSHWGLVISTEFPSSDTRPGDTYKLLQDIKKTSSTFELHVPLPEEEKKANVGSLEQYFPIDRTCSDVLMYVGQTNLMDEEIYSLGESAVQILAAEGCYNGIYRNCQHFSRMMINELCTEVWCPKSIDRLFFGALRLRIFKGRNASMKERIKEFKAFHEAKLVEKETIGSNGFNEALQMDGSTV
jgi:hypothetical protein